jgi:hypothetical protein
MLGHRLLYVWLPVVLTSSVVNAQRLPGSSSKRILARPRKYLAAVSNPLLGHGHLGTQLARSHTEWPIKESITSGLSLLQTHFPGQSGWVGYVGATG